MATLDDALVPNLPVPHPSPPPSPPPSLPNSLPSGVAFSPIWDASICDVVSKSKASDSEINRKHSAKRFSWSSLSALSLGHSAPVRIPVLLIQQPGGSCSGSPLSSGGGGGRGSLGAGWDLVVPPEWGMAFWTALYYRGARVCGLKELQRCSVESQVLHFPHDFPDTVAGQRHSRGKLHALLESYLKQPPQHRVNFGKFVIPSPFRAPWGDCLRSWSKEKAVGSGHAPFLGCGVKRVAAAEGVVESGLPPRKKLKLEGVELGVELARSQGDQEVPLGDGDFGGSGKGVTCVEIARNMYQDSHFYVVRGKSDLCSLNSFISTVLAKAPKQSRRRAYSAAPGPATNLQQFLAAVYCFDFSDMLEEHSGGLVAVRFEIHRSGGIGSLDTISLPSLTDLQESAEFTSFTGPKEKLDKHGKTVVMEKERVLVVGKTLLSKHQLKELKRNGKKKENGVILVDDFQLVPLKPSRRTIGYVTSAGCSLTTSICSGVGFVTLRGLVETVKSCFSAGIPNLLALVRGKTDSYFFVRVTLL